MKKVVFVAVFIIAMLSVCLTACAKSHVHELQEHSGVPATCETAGVKSYYSCRGCDKLFADAEGTEEITDSELTIPPLGHDYPQEWTVVTAATCSKEGLRRKVCANDSKHVLEEHIAKLPHTLSDVEAKEATCDEAGNIAHQKCSVCGAIVLPDGTESTVEFVTVPASHELTPHEKVEETCTTDGVREYYSCSKCGKYFTDETAEEEIVDKNVTIPKHHFLDHHQKQDADCEVDGNIEYYSCNKCGKYFTDETADEEIVDKNVTLPATGHKISETEYDFDEDEHWYKILCGHEEAKDDPRAHREEHTMVKGVCTVCGYEEFTTGLSFSQSEDKESYYVSGYSGSSTSVVIPATYRTLPVTQIAPFAFNQTSFTQTHIEEVFIPDSVTVLGKSAFDHCDSLASVRMSNKVEVIGESAFGGCSSLTELNLPVTLVTVGEFAFFNSGLSAIYYMGTLAEYKAHGLNDQFEAAFSDKFNRTAIYCFDNDKEETEQGFYFRMNGEERESWEITADMAYTKGLTFALKGETYSVTGYQGTSDEIIIPSVYLDAAVTDIADYAFVDYDEASGAVTSSKTVRSLTIGKNLKSIGKFAFYQCGVTELELNDGLQQIGESSFENCPLERIALPSTLESIGSKAFGGTNLSELNVPDGVTSIGTKAFENSKLTTVVLGKNAALGEGAFDACPLEKLYYHGSKADWENVKGDNEFVMTAIYFFSAGLPTDEDNYWHYAGDELEEWPFVSKEDYTDDLTFTANEDGTYFVDRYEGTATEIVVPSLYNRHAVVKIGDEAFKDKPITSIVLGDNVTEIGAGAFENTSLTTFNTKNVSKIGSGAFKGCSALEWIVLGRSTEELNDPFDSNDLTIYYEDTQAHWENVTVTGVELGEKVYYYTEIAPLTSGQYWHYDENTPIAYDAPAIGEDEEYTPGLDFTVDETACYVSGYTGTDTNIVIPSVYRKLPVTKVLKEVFRDKNITSVTFGKYIDTIEKEAFNRCASLRSITFGNYIRSIEIDAFNGCESLSSLEITAGELNIGENAFRDCSVLTRAKIVSTDLTVGANAFAGCNFSELTLSGRIVSIGNGAFGDCRSLNKELGGKFEYWGTLKDWCAISFGNRYANPLFMSETMVLNGEEIVDLVIPRGVKAVSDYAFCGCTSLNSITIGSDVASVGKSAFYKCAGIKYILIEGNVRFFGDSAFASTNVGSVYFSGSLSDWISAEFENDFANPIGGTSFFVNNEYISGDLVIDEDIGAYAFCGYTAIETVTLGEGVHNIGAHAFASCTALNKITVSTSVESMGASAFENCSIRDVYFASEDISRWMAISFGNASANPLHCIHSGNTCVHNFYGGENLIVDLVVPSGVTAISAYAFGNCTSLESVTLTEEVNTIGVMAFAGCRNLAFNDVNNGRYLGTATNDKYALVGVSDKSVTSFTLDDSAEIIADYSFDGCDNLFSLIVGSGLRYVSDDSFGGISLLTAFFSGSEEDWERIDGSETGLDVLRNAALYYYSTEDTGEEGWRYVDDEPLPYGTKGLVYDEADGAYTVIGYEGKEATVVIPNLHLGLPVTKIGDKAFKDPSQSISQTYDFITAVVIGDNVTDIGAEAFYRSRIVSVSGGNGLLNIGKSAFEADDNSQLQSFVFGNELLTIGDRAFRGQPIREVNFGSKLKSIGNNAFQNCAELYELRIPDSVGSIGTSAFSNCIGLHTVIIGDGVTTIGGSAFSGCRNIATLVIGTGLTSIGYDAFMQLPTTANVYYKGETADGYLAITNIDKCYLPPLPVLFSSVYKEGCWHYNNDNIPVMWTDEP